MSLEPLHLRPVARLLRSEHRKLRAPPLSLSLRSAHCQQEVFDLPLHLRRALGARKAHVVLDVRLHLLVLVHVCALGEPLKELCPRVVTAELPLGHVPALRPLGGDLEQIFEALPLPRLLPLQDLVQPLQLLLVLSRKLLHLGLRLFLHLLCPVIIFLGDLEVLQLNLQLALEDLKRGHLLVGREELRLQVLAPLHVLLQGPHPRLPLALDVLDRRLELVHTCTLCAKLLGVLHRALAQVPDLLLELQRLRIHGRLARGEPDLRMKALPHGVERLHLLHVLLAHRNTLLLHLGDLGAHPGELFLCLHPPCLLLGFGRAAPHLAFASLCKRQLQLLNALVRGCSLRLRCPQLLLESVGPRHLVCELLVGCLRLKQHSRKFLLQGLVRPPPRLLRGAEGGHLPLGVVQLLLELSAALLLLVELLLLRR
mmetsp:Transcript_49315/g.120271  ORF Transcript_49315/g.120271 Transcript_49315/m.120271 type:complete len:426 (-) Transcript_49315:726-2003(-)